LRRASHLDIAGEERKEREEPMYDIEMEGNVTGGIDELLPSGGQ
jgi:hypothetical protein